jgi:hypothetical protein
MEISDIERVELRRDVERIQLRRIETRAGALGREVSESQARAERMGASFKTVCEKFLRHSRELNDPKLQSLALREGLKRVQQEKAELTGAQTKLAALRRTQGETLEALATGKARLERLGETLLTIVRRKAHAGEVSQDNALQELMSTARLAKESQSVSEQPTRAAPNTTFEDARQEQLLGAAARVPPGEKMDAEKVTLSLPTEAPTRGDVSPSAACFIGSGSTFVDSGTQDSQRRSPNQQQSAEDTLQQRLRDAGYGSSVKAGDFADRLSGLESWNDSRGSGVSFSFSSSEGRNLRVQLTHLPDKGTVVSLAPESLAEQRLMGRALREVKSSLEEKGMRVAGAHVGSILKGAHRG